MLLGAHMSIAGGVDKALDRGYSIGCTTIQLFTKNNNQWNARKLSDEEIEAFHKKQKHYKISPVIAHNSYLINLASPNKNISRKSYRAFLVEMERCELLKILYLVTHCGSTLGKNSDRGIKTLADVINKFHQDKPAYRVKICLETSAGQGSSLGTTFEQLAAILSNIEKTERVGLCIDTAHIFAAGYDIRTISKCRDVFQEFEYILGIECIKVIHLNDSKKGFGSRIDRHEHIGKGFIGLKAFKFILNERKFKDIPKILETPKGKDLKEDIENITILRSLIKK